MKINVHGLEESKVSKNRLQKKALISDLIDRIGVYCDNGVHVSDFVCNVL